MNDEWDSEYGRGGILDKDCFDHIIFYLPTSISTSDVDDTYYPVIEDYKSSLDLFPSEWTKDNTFMNCINTLLSFNFRDKLILRTKEFL